MPIYTLTDALVTISILVVLVTLYILFAIYTSTGRILLTFCIIDGRLNLNSSGFPDVLYAESITINTLPFNLSFTNYERDI